MNFAILSLQTYSVCRLQNVSVGGKVEKLSILIGHAVNNEAIRSNLPSFNLVLTEKKKSWSS